MWGFFAFTPPSFFYKGDHVSTLTDAKTYAKRVFLEAARELWLQYRAALSSFLSELSRIWDFDLSDFILTALFPPLAVAGVGLNIGGRILATIDALQELRQDISLAPQREIGRAHV